MHQDLFFFPCKLLGPYNSNRSACLCFPDLALKVLWTPDLDVNIPDNPDY